MIEMNNEDKELDEIFHGEEKPLHPDTIYKTFGGSEKAKPDSKKQSNSVKNTPEEKKPEDAQWEPVKPEPNWMDKLKSSAKWALLFGGLSFLIFYWNEAGLMASSIAVPSMCICTALAGWGVGKNAARR